MTVLTIFNHGTANTSQFGTSMTGKSRVLVIAELGRLMPQGNRAKRDWSKSGNENWILNEGAGTQALQEDFDKPWGCQSWLILAGIVAGRGVDDNADRSMAFVKSRVNNGIDASQVTVNLAGHSRGSITCFKIAHRLANDDLTRNCKVNIFAIDPVPGNLGRMNSSSYNSITIQGNVKNSFMMLAESERRTAFRPYLDDVFLANQPQHRLDTMPGNHGKINELGSTEKPWSAEIVLSHAIRFLEHHGTVFSAGMALDARRLSDEAVLDRYARIMINFDKYNKTTKGIRHLGFRLKDKDRVANVLQNHGVPSANRNEDFGGRKLKSSTIPALAAPNSRRFFANVNHRVLFWEAYPGIGMKLYKYEADMLDEGDIRKMWNDGAIMAEYKRMKTREVQGQYLEKWYEEKLGG
jgi:hypothetical protein